MICAEIECAGIDVGKERLAVTILLGPLAWEPRSEYREFGTTVAELQRLRQWLQAEGITHVVMERTGFALGAEEWAVLPRTRSAGDGRKTKKPPHLSPRTATRQAGHSRARAGPW